jgi:hypothetical protein
MERELLDIDPIEIAVGLTPEMIDRIIEVGPQTARWLLAIVKAAELMRQREAS